MILSKALQEAALAMHFLPDRIYGLQPRIPFPKNMTILSKIFSRKSLMQNIKKNSKKQELPTSIP
jgi:hypothetical protein